MQKNIEERVSKGFWYLKLTNSMHSQCTYQVLNEAYRQIGRHIKNHSENQVWIELREQMNTNAKY